MAGWLGRTKAAVNSGAAFIPSQKSYGSRATGYSSWAHSPAAAVTDTVIRPSTRSVRLARYVAEGRTLIWSRISFPLGASSLMCDAYPSEKAGSNWMESRRSVQVSEPGLRRMTLRTAGMPFCIRA